jgi:hypothetical protein
MSIESIISKINKELIGSFAELDSWFDCDEQFLCEKFSSDQWSVTDTLEHVMLTNHYVLSLMTNRIPAATEKDPRNTLQHYTLHVSEIEYLTSGRYPWHSQDHLQPKGITPAEIRSQLRDQLYSCLRQLDLLAGGDEVLFRISIPAERPCELDVYQSLYFLALHAKRHCSLLSGKIRFPVDWLV